MRGLMADCKKSMQTAARSTGLGMTARWNVSTALTRLMGAHDTTKTTMTTRRASDTLSSSLKRLRRVRSSCVLNSVDSLPSTAVLAGVVHIVLGGRTSRSPVSCRCSSTGRALPPFACLNESRLRLAVPPAQRDTYTTGLTCQLVTLSA